MLAAAAGVAAGGSALWHYNRGNFLFDRKLRQEQEFAIFEWRKAQAELWREDVRDIIEMTEKKMDSYLVISALQLGMCSTLFACGRLEPGTPPWLLSFYLLTLGGAFLYLLMSVWFAMHAGVAAQCTSVRMLTQFVRLPVPTWHDFEGARTYASSYEQVRGLDMLRVPFTGSLASGDNPASATMAPAAKGHGYEEWLEGSGTTFAATSGSGEPGAGDDDDEDGEREYPDPWRLEKHGNERGFYELQRIALDMRRHIRLARQAALQFQCFDAFARVSMSFGTHQLLFALAHYSLGYLCVQDGSILAPLSVVCIMAGISSMMMHTDFSLSKPQLIFAVAVTTTGLMSSAIAVFAWSQQAFCRSHGFDSDRLVSAVLPCAYAANMLWIFSARRACGIEEAPVTKVMLPMSFRAVLYLDVFGWFTRSQVNGSALGKAAKNGLGSCVSGQTEPCQEPSPRTTKATPGSTGLSRSGKPPRKSVLQRVFQGPPKPASPMFEQPHGNYVPINVMEQPSSYSSVAAAASSPRCAGPRDLAAPRDRGDKPEHKDVSRRQSRGPGGEFGHPPEHAFAAKSWLGTTMDDGEEDHLDDEESSTGLDLKPMSSPARLFLRATWLLTFLWLGATMPQELLKQVAKPTVADIFVEKVDPKTGDMRSGEEVHAVVGTDVNGLPTLIPITEHHKITPPSLGESRRLRVSWPVHSAFIPRSLTCDQDGERIIVSDDFATYAGAVEEVALRATQDASAPPPKPKLALSFESTPSCVALEGIAFDDIGAVCEPGGRCDVVVLHDNGRTLTVCPTQGSEDLGTSRKKRSWRISSEWLNSKEHVTSIAMRSPCFAEKAGCVVAGTSEGRIVELTAVGGDSPEERTTLIPSHIVHDVGHPCMSGSVADYGGQYLLYLAYQTGIISVYGDSGQLVGEWKLPDHVRWLMVCAGGDHLFALGVITNPAAGKSEKTSALVGLHRFSVPEALRLRQLPEPSGAGDDLEL